MRFLNKIVFIHSASINYAEVNLDGNIHFIGTQGVGKSTVLRAILYFYNAESRKLGVPTGPTNKTFAEWYFPKQNSYIIYEIKRETGDYCVMAFKSQNRVCFRFLDTPYNQKLFVTDGNVLTSWEQIQSKLVENRIQSSRKINSYDEYRDIIYGNNHGKSEFRKYALLEAKQYKNIPRTIQNVFLNSKLDADFIKQTIISSMNEEDLPIDLQQYAEHLLHLKPKLKDIKTFRYPSVIKFTESSIQSYVSITQKEKEKRTLAAQLAFKWQKTSKELPLLKDEISLKNTELSTVKTNLAKEKNRDESRKNKVQSEVVLLKNNLKKAKEYKDKYIKLNIHSIIERSQVKNDLEHQKQGLEKEREVLNSNFADINQKYQALLDKQTHQSQQFTINKNQESFQLEKNELIAKEAIREEYTLLVEELEEQQKQASEQFNQQLNHQSEWRVSVEKELIKAEHKAFYKTELEQFSQELTAAKNKQAQVDHTVAGLRKRH